jgi:RNA polymerase subunit RPABC4/transcription elongation factor Spt4
MDNLTEVVSGNLGKALEEVDKLLRNPRTRIEIVTLRRQMGNVTSELGKRTLDLYKGGRVNDPELAELCARIISIEARIAEREARLAIQAQSQSQGQDAPAEPAGEPGLTCPRCKTLLPEDAVFCFKCGLEMEQAPAQTETQSRFCPQCGRELRPGANFCPRCGAAA